MLLTHVIQNTKDVICLLLQSCTYDIFEKAINVLKNIQTENSGNHISFNNDNEKMFFPESRFDLRIATDVSVFLET